MNKAILSFILLVSTIDFTNSAAIEKLSAKHPYNLLTSGYGIVTEDDLAYDNHRREIGPYNPEKSLSELYWQCFPTDAVTAGFEAWVGPDGMGPADATYIMCTLDISVRKDGEKQPSLTAEPTKSIFASISRKPGKN